MTKTDIKNLEILARKVPTMSGHAAGQMVRQYAREAIPGAIVEVGAWLGSITAYLALGVLEAKKDTAIHVFDRFEAAESEVMKARAQGCRLKPHKDTLPIVEGYLAPFRAAGVVFHKGDIRKAKWDTYPIAVYVDDASKRQPTFDHVTTVFGKYWQSGTVLILLDFFYFEKNKDPGFKYQKEYMDAWPERFEFIERVPGTSGAVFRVK